MLPPNHIIRVARSAAMLMLLPLFATRFAGACLRLINEQPARWFTFARCRRRQRYVTARHTVIRPAHGMRDTFVHVAAFYRS